MHKAYFKYMKGQYSCVDLLSADSNIAKECSPPAAICFQEPPLGGLIVTGMEDDE